MKKLALIVTAAVLAATGAEARQAPAAAPVSAEQATKFVQREPSRRNPRRLRRRGERRRSALGLRAARPDRQPRPPGQRAEPDQPAGPPDHVERRSGHGRRAPCPSSPRTSWPPSSRSRTAWAAGDRPRPRHGRHQRLPAGRRRLDRARHLSGRRIHPHVQGEQRLAGADPAGRRLRRPRGLASGELLHAEPAQEVVGSRSADAGHGRPRPPRRGQDRLRHRLRRLGPRRQRPGVRPAGPR
uniref:Secreted protein n=1 Tax=Parastrongyloides trichosuri TaxID=131310 RepID=A0A0N4Z6A3_PARTI